MLEGWMTSPKNIKWHKKLAPRSKFGKVGKWFLISIFRKKKKTKQKGREKDWTDWLSCLVNSRSPQRGPLSRASTFTSFPIPLLFFGHLRDTLSRVMATDAVSHSAKSSTTGQTSQRCHATLRKWQKPKSASISYRQMSTLLIHIITISLYIQMNPFH